MLRKFKIPIIIVATALLTQAVGFAVQAAMPASFLPAGTTRYAVAQSTSPTATYSSGWLPLIGQTITLPPGKTADIMVTFCGDGWVQDNSKTTLQVKVQIAGVVASPGQVDFSEDLLGGYHCAAFYRSGGVAGTVPVKVYWRSLNNAYFIAMTARSLVVIANIR